jgi:hypothetical protein
MKKNTTPARKAESFEDILEDLVKEKVHSFIQDILEEEMGQWLGRDLQLCGYLFHILLALLT